MTSKPQIHAAPFQSSGGFTYSALVRPLARPVDHLNLRITTRWAGARDPQAEQLAFDVTLSRPELSALIAALQCGLEKSA